MQSSSRLSITLTTPHPGLCLAGLLALIVVLVAPVQAGTDEGIAAFEAGDYERAYRELKPEADAGSEEAQYYLAQMYDYGNGIEKDSAKALELFRLSADQGYPAAQVALGFSYDEGIGVPVDDEKAVSLYKQAATAGYAIAQRNLGLMYKEGEGVKRDYQEAAKWFRHAAEQEDAVAQNELCGLYYDGFGVPHDYRRAAYWCRRGAENGNAHAQYTLQGLILQGLGSGGGSVSAYAWALYAARQDFPGGKQAWKNRRIFLSESQERQVLDLVESNQWPPFPRFTSEEKRELLQRGEGDARVLH